MLPSIHPGKTMEAITKENLTNRNVWARLLYMILFGAIYIVAEMLVLIVAVFQFLMALFTGGVNEIVLRFGQNLSAYMYEILQFVTFNDEHLPFPFSDWPDREPGGTQWVKQDGGSAAGDDPH